MIYNIRNKYLFTTRVIIIDIHLHATPKKKKNDEQDHDLFLFHN